MVQRGEACDDRTELDELKFGERDRQECLSYEAVSFLAREHLKYMKDGRLAPLTLFPWLCYP